jgi:predicted O-methyltransferase YrrM
MTWTNVKGWETPAEQGLLAMLASRVPYGGTSVEIGSEFGMSASIFLQYAPLPKNLYCVEINPEAPFLENLKKAGINAGAVSWLKGSSHEIPYPGDKIDLLFIDGDHSESGAYKDIDIWSQRVKPNGIIVVHDCACSTNKNPHPDHYSVMTAIYKWLAETGSKKGWRIAFSVDSTVVLMRVVND